MEEKADKRFDNYTQSVHRSRKRQRLVDDALNEEVKHIQVINAMWLIS